MGISRRIAQITNGTFEVKAGSLFPALHRMEEAAWLTSSWRESETNRRARFYRLNQPKISAMLAGRFRGYSVERLMRFLVALGHDVEIVVKASNARYGRTSHRVESREPCRLEPRQLLPPMP